MRILSILAFTLFAIRVIQTALRGHAGKAGLFFFLAFVAIATLFFVR